MTPPQKTEPSPTLLELLELCARDYEHMEHPLGPVVPYEFACRELADRLRAAAQHLREEMERAAKYPENETACAVLGVLRKINGPISPKESDK